MAGKEPQVGRDVELGHDMALAVLAPVFRDVGDAVHHQHRRLGQLGVARPEQLSARAGKQVVAVEAGLGHRHADLAFL
jgi:hypothetical protein